MAKPDLPRWYPGEPVPAAKLNAMVDAITDLSEALAIVTRELEALKNATPATKPATTRKTSTKAE